MPFLAGETLTAARLNAAIGQVSVKTSNKTVTNNATYSPDTQLAIAVEANATYVFESFLIYSADGAADVKFALSGPAGFTASITPDGLPTGTGGSTDVIDRGLADGTLTGGVPAGGRGIGTGARSVATPSGYFTIGATAGTVTLNFAQLTAHVSDAVLYTGSWIRVTKRS